MKYVLTKARIENLAKEVYDYLNESGMIDNCCIYYNHKRIVCYNDNHNIEEDVHPCEYCKYASKNNILTITSEGSLHEIYNYEERDLPIKLRAIFNKYGLYAEAITDWCWSVFTKYDKSHYEIEYDSYSVPDPIFIYHHGEAPEPLKNIMDIWYDLSAKTGDIGCCVIGAYMRFKYNDVVYEMAPCSPWQGEGSWTRHIGTIKELLKQIGATDIYWNCGIMD